jgi:hypothetical protein
MQGFMQDRPLIEFKEEPALDSPVLIYNLEGWIDIGMAASLALAFLKERSGARELAHFDSDRLIDFRARRPMLSVADGVTEALAWPKIVLLGGRLPGGIDSLILQGPEPDMNWHAFMNEVASVTTNAEAVMGIGLGSFPAPIPHTRTAPLLATSPVQEVAARIGFIAGKIQVPGGVQSAIEIALHEAGITSIGLWARVPHYLSAMGWPAAAISLLEGVEKLLGISLDVTELSRAAQSARSRVDEIVAANDETREYVRQLEEAANASGEPEAGAISLDGITGDQIARELEQFLASQESPEDGSDDA